MKICWRCTRVSDGEREAEYLPPYLCQYCAEQETIKNNWVIFDIDGCISDDTHRAHLAVKGEHAQYHKLAKNDTIKRAESYLVKSLSGDGYRIALMSGRPESMRGETEAWLWENRIPYDLLLLRPLGFTRPSVDLKLDWLITEFCINHERRLLFAVDDDPLVIEVFKNRGINVLHSVSRRWRDR